jgi:hypothetical protein
MGGADSGTGVAVEQATSAAGSAYSARLMGYVSHGRSRVATALAVVATVAAGVPARRASAQEATETPPPAVAAKPLPAEIPPLPEWPDYSKRPAYDGRDAVEVVIASTHRDEPVMLLEQTPAGWRAICTSPCRAQVDPKDTFGIGGYGLHPSLPFRLDGASTITASPESGPGFGLTFAGLFCMGHGGIFLGTGLALGHDGPGPVFAVLGGIEVAVGVPLALLALYKATTRTTLDVKKGVAAAGQPFVWRF